MLYLFLAMSNLSMCIEVVLVVVVEGEEEKEE